VKVLLLSIKPEYANKILDGEKSIEFRRVRPNVEAGDLCLIYASGAQRALIGAFEVGGVVETSAPNMWRKWGKHAGADRATFMNYFDGSKSAYGILIRNSERLKKEIPLVSLRKLFTGFRPPQSFRYLSTEQVDHRTLLRRVFCDLDGRLPHPVL